MSVLIAIPARYASTRYPGKPLVVLRGPDGDKTLIRRSWEAAVAVRGVDRVVVATDDARIADNAGAQPIDEPIAPAGPAAYFATVPVKAIVAAMRAVNVPAAPNTTSAVATPSPSVVTVWGSGAGPSPLKVNVTDCPDTGARPGKVLSVAVIGIGLPANPTPADTVRAVG